VKADIVIAGSGVSGLTAAAILARKGRRVVVLERQSRPGGSLRQFSRQGIGFDVGFHYTGCLGEGEILDLLWHYCGVASRITRVSLADKGYDSFEFPDREGAVHGYFAYDKLAEELKSQFPADAWGIDNYLQAIRESCAAIPFYNTSLPLTPFLRGMRPSGTPLQEVLDHNVRDTHLQAVLQAPAFLYGVPLNRVSFENHAMVAHGYYNGAYITRDGGQAIVDAFLASLAEKGVELLTGSALSTICVEDGSVSGVVTQDGRRISCSQVIYTGHPAHVIDMVPDKIFRPSYCKRLKSLANTLSMFGVFGVSDKQIDPLRGALNYYYLPSPGQILPEHPEVPHSQRPLLLTGTRNGHDEFLQASGNGIILLRPGYWREVGAFSSEIRSRGEGYAEFKARITREMVTQAEELWHERCGSIKSLATGSPLTFRDELSAPEGCTYGAMHCLDQYNPDIRTRLQGLYLCGQSTLMTGVVGASISALVAAGEITDLETLWEEMKRCR